MDSSFALIIFGITSNLALRYLIPALYDMAEKDLLPANINIIGNARRELSEDEYKKYIVDVLHKENRHHQHPIKKEVADELLERMHYISGNLDDSGFYLKLKEFLDKLNVKDKVFYLATYPDLYHYIFENLHKVGLSKQDDGYARLMIEKPIGKDLKSAKELNELILKYFSEDQIFRLDHYLGKETLQNILAFRFANGIFEPMINKDHVDHIQINATEDFGIGDRGGYYDNVGALVDVGQNHQLQMLAFATMDAPVEFSNRAITDERFKILKNLIAHPQKLVLGQYEGYRSEKNVNPDSQTDTFYAFKTEIDNDRFKGVPIYIRAGKKLKKTVTEISIIFKTPHNRLFKDSKNGMEPNVLVYRIQPNEGIVFKVLVKKPGFGVELESEFMQYCYELRSSSNRLDPHNHYIPDDHERLISDAIRGDQTFFNDANEVEAQWEFIEKLSSSKPKVMPYKEGTWGPKEADELIEADGRKWLEPSEDFCKI